ncbi:MAG: DUF1552 domain-containing protein [Pirellulales bacterium]|jgi:hypothetical protein
MTITRRSLLKNAVSFGSTAAIFTPFLNSVAVHAAGDAAAMPKRFIFIVKASGLANDELVPSGYADAKAAYRLMRDKQITFRRDNLVDVSLADVGLPEVLKPLEAFRDRVNVVQGLSGNNLKGNHTSGYGTLSCYNSERAAVAPTVDALLGLQHSTGPYPMFGMATNGALLGQQSIPEDAYVYPNISALKSGQGVAFQASPTKAFNELFGSAVMSEADLKKDSAVKRNLMDFLKDDAKRIRKRLTPFDRERFDGYVDTFESLRLRDQRKTALKDHIEKNAPDYIADKYTAMNHMDRMESQFELGTAAIIAGLTNVITLRPDTLGAQYQKLGTGTLGLHQIGHGSGVGDITSPQLRSKIDNYHMGLIAKMAKRFNSIPEGDGTMLDNTLIVYTSCAGGMHHGGITDWPFITVGGIGGKLKTGRHLLYPSYANDGHKSIANLYMSIMTAADTHYGKYFGQLDPGLRDLDLRGPLTELLA